MTRAVLRWPGLLLALFLGACSGLNQPIPGSATQSTSQVEHPAPPEFWQIRSRLSVRHGQQAWSGSLRWHHLAGGDEITIRDPIGRTRLRASDLPDKDNPQLRAPATLQLAGQPVRHGESVEDLLRSVGELAIPFEHFPAWLTATPGKTSATSTDPDSGLITQITDHGWTITYQQYRSTNGVQLPRKLLISGHDTEIRMVISKWLPAAR
ncbi:MAG: outer membrane lipoprotein LolB [Immundisolibacteraceae bacterium]|nr:outer membrane lipoprotein LolB [Immundisolibacteraceae bacterium]